MKPTLPFAFALFAVTGCSAGDDIDSTLVGTWELGDADAPEERWVFSDDGAFTFDELGGNEANNEHFTGTWFVSGTELVTEGVDGEGARFEMVVTYYVDDVQLGFPGLLPVGVHDGFVGTWTGRTTIVVDAPDPDDDLDLDRLLTIENRADGTSRYHSEEPAGSTAIEFEGTWEESEDEPGSYVCRYPDEFDVAILRFKLIGDAALVGTVYRRVRS